MCTGRPSAEASKWLSPVRMQQEKSRALEMTADRAARSSVLVISRTMPSSRLAITVITIGSRCAADALDFFAAFFDARLAAFLGIGRTSRLQDVVPGRADEGAHARIDHDGRGRLLDDRRAGDEVAGLELGAAIDVGLALVIGTEIGGTRHPWLGLAVG